MTSESVTVVNQLGMHARAAAKFVHLATRFEARVRVSRERREMDELRRGPRMHAQLVHDHD